MTTAPGTGRRWQRPGGQYVENNFFGTVDAHGAQIGIINLGAAAEPDPPGSIRDAAIALFDDPAPPATDKPSTPGAWLDPRAGIVPARHRPEISELVAWCRSEPGPVARLMCAAGGQGKTHLAIGLCAALAASPEPERRRLRRRDRPWLAGFVRLPALSWQSCDRAERARWLRLVAPRRSVGVWFIYRFPSVYDNSKAERDLGFRTTVPLVETFRRQIRWMEEVGQCPPVDKDPCEECLLQAWKAGDERIDDPRWVDFNPWGNDTEN